jgi:hypothetical protein
MTSRIRNTDHKWATKAVTKTLQPAKKIKKDNKNVKKFAC